MWSERNLLNSLLWEAAVDDMGIYPRAVVVAGVETELLTLTDAIAALRPPGGDPHE